MSTVRIEDHDAGVRLLTLDRPPANAIDEELLSDLAAACTAARNDDSVRAVILTGAGRFLSAGFDLRAERRDDASADRLADLYRDAHLALLELPKPTLAMVQGHAIAGGLVLALACDYRLGLDGDYKVGLNEVSIGASFPRVAMEIVRLRLTHARAAELLLGAAIYPASQVLSHATATEIYPPSLLDAIPISTAARMGAFPRESYAHTKAALIADAVRSVRAETPEEARAATAVWTTDESRAARAAQRKKLEG